MALRIETFDNVRGGNTLYKALTHPHAAAPGRALVAELRAARPGRDRRSARRGGGVCRDFRPRPRLDIAGGLCPGRRRGSAGRSLGRARRAADRDCRTARRARCWSPAFDADRLIEQLAPYLPAGATVLSLDAMRIPADAADQPPRLSRPAQFRDQFRAVPRHRRRLHTRLVTANYWAGYGAGGGHLLADPVRRRRPDHRRMVARRRRADGGAIVDRQPRGARAASASASSPASSSSMSSARPGTTSSNTRSTPLATATRRCRAPTTPMPGRPTAMPGCRRRRRASGSCCGSRTATRRRSRPARSGSRRWAKSGSSPIDEPIGAVRQPRGRCRRAAAGRSPGRGRSSCAPASTSCGRATRSSTERPPPHRPCQCRARRSAARTRTCPSSPRRSARAICCRRRSCRAASGKACCCRRRWRCRRASCRSPRSSTTRTATRSRGIRFGRLPRDHATALSTSTRWRRRSATATAMSSWSTISPRAATATAGCTRCSAIATARSGHAAETSFGAHVFNTILTYRDEPQSYTGRPPGLSTRLFLRLGDGAYDTLCHLIYPASLPWRPTSATEIILHDARGREIARTIAGDPLLRLAAVALSRAVRRGDPRPRRRRRLCRRSATRPAGCSAITGSSGASGALQPRPYVRVLRRADFRRAASRRARKMVYYAVQSIGNAGCPSIITARS